MSAKKARHTGQQRDETPTRRPLREAMLLEMGGCGGEEIQQGWQVVGGELRNSLNVVTGSLISS